MADNDWESGKLLRSFLVVVLAYVLLMCGSFALMILLAAVFFPPVFAIWTHPDPEQFRQVWDQQPQRLWPMGLCIATLAATSGLALAAGWVTARLAPFSRFVHGVFLALIALVSFLQIALSTNTRNAVPQGLLIGLVALVPTAVVAGAWIATRRRA